jgi:hypothetical protein
LRELRSTRCHWTRGTDARRDGIKVFEASGKQVKFVAIPESAMREALLGFGLPEWQAEGLIEDYAHYRRGEAANVSTAVQEVTGHPARSFEGFARDYKELLQLTMRVARCPDERV